MLYSYGYDRVVAMSTSLLQDVPTPTDQVPFFVVSHAQRPAPAGAPLFSHHPSIGHSQQAKETARFGGDVDVVVELFGWSLGDSRMTPREGNI